MHDSGGYNAAGIAELFSISRPAVYRSLNRAVPLPPHPARTDITRYDQILAPGPPG